jgi:hypothetical protein
VANRYFEEIEGLEEALVERCVALCDQPEIIRSYIPAITGGRRWHEHAGLFSRIWYKIVAAELV